MGNVLMGDLDGKTERIVFYTHEIEQIITKYKASIASGNDEQDYMEYPEKNIFARDIWMVTAVISQKMKNILMLKIMDINDAQMDAANIRCKELEQLMERRGEGEGFAIVV